MAFPAGHPLHGCTRGPANGQSCGEGELIGAGGIVTLAAVDHCAPPFSHFLLVPSAASRVVRHGAFVISKMGPIFGIRIGRMGVPPRCSPTFGILGVTLADHRKFVQVQLADCLMVMRPIDGAACCRISRFVCHGGGRHHCSDDGCDRKQIDPHCYFPGNPRHLLSCMRVIPQIYCDQPKAVRRTERAPGRWRGTVRIERRTSPSRLSRSA